MKELIYEEIMDTNGGSLIGFIIGFAGAALEKASEIIAAHPVGGSHYE